MFGKDFSSVLKLTAYGDGSADINMMGDRGSHFLERNGRQWIQTLLIRVLRRKVLGR